MAFGRKRRTSRNSDVDPDDLGADRIEATDALVDDDALDHAGAEAAMASGAEDSPIGTGGPYDRDEVPGLQGRLDLGSLWLMGTPGMQMRLDMDPDSGEMTSVTTLLGQSSIQLQAFAAPKSEGIWTEIRTEIAQSVTEQGGTAEETQGALGTELLTRIPARGADGRTLHQQVRFVGVDGPRWFLRGVITGPAAADAAMLPPLLFVMSTAVVVRGAEARAPRELLPLTLPEEEVSSSGGPIDQEPPGSPHVEDFAPFERGPEITEIR